MNIKDTSFGVVTTSNAAKQKIFSVISQIKANSQWKKNIDEINKCLLEAKKDLESAKKFQDEVTSWEAGGEPVEFSVLYLNAVLLYANVEMMYDLTQELLRIFSSSNL